MVEDGPRGRKRKGPSEGSDGDGDFPSASGSKRGRVIQYSSDSEEEELQREERSKQKSTRQGQGEQLADLNDLGEEELKVYVAQQKSAVAERALYGRGTQGLECSAPTNLTQYEKEMGYTIEPFNTDEERRTGRFDTAGFWTRDREEDEEAADPWLAEVDEASKSGQTATMAASGSPEGNAVEQPAPQEAYEHYAVLLDALRPGETLPAAIRRLKPLKAPMFPKWKQQRQQRQGQGQAQQEAEKVTPAASTVATAVPQTDTKAADFNRLMEAAHTLMDAGVVEVYSYTYEELAQRAARMRAVESGRAPTPAACCQPAATEVEDAPGVANAVGKQWEFCWLRDPGAEVYGPYSSAQMQAWKEHGFFSAGRVAYARVKDEDMFATEEREFQEAHTLDFGDS